MTFSEKTHFIELYSREQKKIFLYILSMVHRQSDAEDIMQQTAADMWRLGDRDREIQNPQLSEKTKQKQAVLKPGSL